MEVWTRPRLPELLRTPPAGPAPVNRNNQDSGTFTAPRQSSQREPNTWRTL